MPSNPQEHAQREQLRSKLRVCSNAEIGDWTQEPRLGSEGGFVSLTSEFERVKAFTKALSEADLDILPAAKFQALDGAFGDLLDVLRGISQLKAQADTRDRNGLSDQFRQRFKSFFDEAAPVAGMLQDRSAPLVEWRTLLDEAKAELAARSEESTKAILEIRQSVDAAKLAARYEGISTQATYFQLQANEHLVAGKWWLGLSGVILVAVLSVSVWSVNYYLQNPPSPGAEINFQLIAAKLVLFSALFSALVSASRSYKAHRHNYVVNKHRLNALKTFRAFSEQAETDSATKQAVLMQTTQCIFSPQPSGYSSVEPESAPPWLELARLAIPDKR